MGSMKTIKTQVSQVGHCRVCGAKAVQRIFHLPQMPFTDDFIPPSKFGLEFRADIDIYVCKECLTVQTQHDVSVGDYYEDYQYSVGGSVIANRFMRLLAENLKKSYYPSITGKKILEVGSGDGEQLLAFKETGCQVLGFEPSSSLCEVARHKGIPTIQGLFGPDSEERLPPDYQNIDIIMLSYTFDHLPDPRKFLATAHSILSKTNGLLVVEIHDLEKLLERQEYCLFEHEHSIYLNESTASHLCKLENFEIINFDLVPENDRRANSLIFVATPCGSTHGASAAVPRTPPAQNQLNFYEQVGPRIHRAISNLEFFVDEVTSSGRTLAGYGAGGRGVMTLAAMKNASSLRYLVDKKPKGPGLLVPKVGIPLVDPQALKHDRVDEILVFSYGYLEEIKEELLVFGYQPSQLHSMLNILAGRPENQ